MRKGRFVALCLLLTLAACTAAHAQAPGNHPAMLYHGGYAAKDGDWIYFSTARQLLRMRTDGSELSILLEAEVKNINVSGGWLYYCIGGAQQASRIYRMRTDGSEQQTVLDEGTMFYVAAGDCLYYQPFSDAGLQRITPESGAIETVLEARCERFSIADDVLYASYKDAAGYTLRSYQLPDMTPIASFYTPDVLLYAGEDGWLYTKGGYADVLLALSYDGADAKEIKGVFGNSFDGSRYFRVENAGSFWRGDLFLGAAGPILCLDMVTGQERKVASGYHTTVLAAIDEWVISMEYFPDTEAYAPSILNMETGKALPLPE